MNSWKTLSRLTAATLLVTCGCAAAAAEDTAPDGAQLYLAKACQSCHGADGRTPIMPVYPIIAGQHGDYTYNQLRDIKSGARSNRLAAIMVGIMAGVSDEEMRAIADWLSTQ